MLYLFDGYLHDSVVIKMKIIYALKQPHHQVNSTHCILQYFSEQIRNFPFNISLTLNC